MQSEAQNNNLSLSAARTSILSGCSLKKRHRPHRVLIAALLLSADQCVNLDYNMNNLVQTCYLKIRNSGEVKPMSNPENGYGFSPNTVEQTPPKKSHLLSQCLNLKSLKKKKKKHICTDRHLDNGQSNVLKLLLYIFTSGFLALEFLDFIKFFFFYSIILQLCTYIV